MINSSGELDTPEKIQDFILEFANNNLDLLKRFMQIKENYFFKSDRDIVADKEIFNFQKFEDMLLNSGFNESQIISTGAISLVSAAVQLGQTVLFKENDPNIKVRLSNTIKKLLEDIFNHQEKATPLLNGVAFITLLSTTYSMFKDSTEQLLATSSNATLKTSVACKI
jgi:hypothetical protein